MNGTLVPVEALMRRVSGDQPESWFRWFRSFRGADMGNPITANLAIARNENGPGGRNPAEPMRVTKGSDDMIVANRPPTAAPACRAFLRRFSTELTDRGIRVARIRSGLAWRDSAGRLRWVHCLPYSRHVPRIYCSTHIVPRSLHTRLRATGGLPPAWRGEISAVAAELPLLAVWLADHANSGWHHHPLPVPEYRQWHWGREYRWSAAGNEAWMQYDRPVSQRRVSQCDTR